MKLNNIPGVLTKKAKRIGRGHGSGKGKTSSRGTKGQKSRGRINPSFEGGQLRIVKRLPFRRGVGNPGYKSKFVVLNVSDLNQFEAGSVVDAKFLVEKGMISQGDARKGVKILGNGELKVALTVNLSMSKVAKEKIGGAGGTTPTEAVSNN
ncbi:MAG: 50S ribosomal protein L15 [Candidatus Woykebacteria bacterium RIFCSPHIGHO2_12_FULL_43_10]|uniref:Large ribosomal subunit protein uL15 n=2 Tax=Candidatus Woykeibacteriota TaxID=1817899 RepID=A0A1G1WY15_9BACT|nr:MAG: 50S ribosomal protein L15 [Candidatus Woykebacteria bacterium RIFCSPHIGHO2_01_FULL_43_29]OGY28712.1 MAG: 50S ribosomal protein L15 [Candidatus Woykebacteria bacterium RIFCSPHIGHO2_02_FULL_43_16b]OGY29787.1 MAG: 50S ribosomal protein L15 [Candidatus Woykebacteria bacterium RIFCSPHIGHO2_12_FULL_43_10]OGY32461.1 MAG: 50S ribosomal protein L15 [Candidatus Woykebacteria bacterium RIFCSPLOWO2_01_FULL_43_14]